MRMHCQILMKISSNSYQFSNSAHPTWLVARRDVTRFLRKHSRSLGRFRQKRHSFWQLSIIRQWVNTYFFQVQNYNNWLFYWIITLLGEVSNYPTTHKRKCTELTRVLASFYGKINNRSRTHHPLCRLSATVLCFNHYYYWTLIRVLLTAMRSHCW